MRAAYFCVELGVYGYFSSSGAHSAWGEVFYGMGTSWFDGVPIDFPLLSEEEADDYTFLPAARRSWKYDIS